MANKYLISDKRQLLKNRLDKLSKNLIQANSLDTLQTNEQVISETIKVLNSFYRDLTAPVFNPDKILSADLPSRTMYNEIFSDISDDLSVIFSELENIETFSIANFNFVSTEANRLFSRLKSVSSKLGDFLLYSRSKSGIYFTDSFNNTLKLDVGSVLLNELQCDINQDEGVITLPINKDKTVLVNITETPIIDTQSSNGVVGNNREVDTVGRPVQTHSNINLILDNNPDTWFEYERVLALDEEPTDPLVLELTINLGKPQVINRVVVNPNNFGTKNPITISEIKTSIDGFDGNYIDIKDDIPIAGFLEENEENVFNLAPATSKYAGQGIYTFTPRKAKYIRFRFEQSEYYIIPTSVGSQNLHTGKAKRYAIGLRDISIYSLVFEPKGEVISRAFLSANEIKKAILESSQNPARYSELGSIQYFLSPNDGQDWYEIQTRGFTGQSGVASEVPEILNINTIDEGSITTPTPAYSLRLKSLLSRNDENFTEERAASFQQIQKFTTELHSIPVESPFSFQLEKIPIDGSISISQPFFSARGKEANKIEFKFEDSNAPFYPFGNVSIPRPPVKTSKIENDITVYETKHAALSDFLHVLVAGEEWEEATKSLKNHTPASYTEALNRKYFWFDLKTGKLEFGDNSYTCRPDTNNYIGVYLDAEKLYFEKSGNNYYTTPIFTPASLNKDDFTIKRYYPIATTTEILTKEATEVRLGHRNIIDTSYIALKLGGTQKTYLNGEAELAADGDWSIDTENGIIYLYTSTDPGTNVTVQYSYQQVDVLTNDEWDWDDNNLNRLFIRGNAFKTSKREELSLPTTNNRQTLHLADTNVVKTKLGDSLVFNLIDVNGNDISDDEYPFLEEIEYVNGGLELQIPGYDIEVVTEYLKLVSGSYFAPGSVVSSAPYRFLLFDLKEIVSSDTSHAPVFSSKNFITEKSSISNLTTKGDYFVDRPNNRVILYFYSPSNIGNLWKDYNYGTVKYYKVPISTVSSLGRYSVDYARGIVYTDRAMKSNWILSVDYSYSDYRAYYNIARDVSSTDYSVDIPERTITIKDKEILSRYALPEMRANLYYSVNYRYAEQSRTDIPELKDYFTPVLKAYGLRMITDKDLF